MYVCNSPEDPRGWDDGIKRYIEANAVIYEILIGASLFSNEESRGAPGSAWGGEALVGEVNDLDGCVL